MRRQRTVNASPERSSGATVDVLVELINACLASSEVSAATVTEALDVARPALLMLVSGRHLKTSPVVLVAAHTTCEFYCRYDDPAVAGEENLNAVPGMGAAQTFTLYLPASGSLTDTIARIVSTNEHLSVAATPAPANTAAKTAGAGVVTSRGPLDLASLENLL